MKHLSPVHGIEKGSRFEKNKVYENRPELLFGLLLSAIACLVIFNRLFTKTFFPSIDFYQTPFLAYASLREVFSYNPAIAAITIAILLVPLYLIFNLKWVDVCSSQTRAFILLMAALLVWRNSTFGYNYFIDVSHHADRLLLITIFLLSLWRPVFLVLMFPQIFLLQGQLSINFISYSPAEMSMPLKLLAAFCILLFFRQFYKFRFDPMFIWLAIVIIMSHYWTAAYAKFLIDWHKFGQIHNMFSAGYAGGWLGFLDTESISKILKITSKFDKPAMVITFAFETAVIFSLFNGTVLIVLLALASVFHITVFAVSGICFWQWMLIDIAFIYLLYIKSNKSYLNPSYLPIYTRITLTLLIAVSPFWMGAARLGWHDSPVNYIYQLRAFDSENNSEVLTPAYFTPYEYPFTLNSLQFLSESKTLPISWGATRELTLAKELAESSSKQDILELIEQQGSVKFEELRAKYFDRFVADFVRNKQAKKDHKSWFDHFPAPLYLFTKLQIRQIHHKQIQRVEVTRLTSWFDGTKFQTIDKTLVRTIPIETDS